MNRIILLSIVVLLGSCTGPGEKASLPYLGFHSIDSNIVEGNLQMDTAYFRIPRFAFMNQDSLIIDNESLRGKVYVADFFFSYCPDICIPMKTQMLRVHEEFRELEDLKLLSHTLDPEHDSIPFLKSYSDQLGADSKQWYFLNGEEAVVYEIAEKGYMSYAARDASAPGGIAHGGHFVLVDRQGHIRGVYDGTKEQDVDILMLHILQLLDE